MTQSRRDFLKIAGLSAISLTLPASVCLASGSAGVSPAGMKRERGRLARRDALPPLKGQRWAMAVQIQKCKARCRDCITACHRLHNVPDFDNPKDKIQWIAAAPFGQVFPGELHPRLPKSLGLINVPVFCNHCENPPCVRVCPTKATFKRADGITMMDYHRCIGCRFCMAACPYGSRRMNYRDPRPFIRQVNPDFPTRTAGVVEKCNFCEERLSRGIMPACVMACPQKSLVFGDLEDPRSEVRHVLGAGFSLRRRPELGTEPQIYYIL